MFPTYGIPPESVMFITKSFIPMEYYRNQKCVLCQVKCYTLVIQYFHINLLQLSKPYLWNSYIRCRNHGIFSHEQTMFLPWFPFSASIYSPLPPQKYVKWRENLEALCVCVYVLVFPLFCFISEVRMWLRLSGEMRTWFIHRLRFYKTLFCLQAITPICLPLFYINWKTEQNAV